MSSPGERWNPGDPGYSHLVKAEETAYSQDGVGKLIDIMARSGYSCRNSLLVYAQRDECKLESISDLRTEEAWEKAGRTVDIYNPGIQISVPDSSPFSDISFRVHTVFDVSQTQGASYTPIAKSRFLQTQGYVYAAKYILASMGVPKENVVKRPHDVPVDYDLSSGQLVFSEKEDVKEDALAWFSYARAKLLFSDRKDVEGMARAVYQITARQIGTPIDDRMNSFSIEKADYQGMVSLYQASTGMLRRIEKELQKSRDKSHVQEGGQER